MTILTSAQIGAARRLGAATLHEAAGRTGALPPAIKPVAPEMTLAGAAFTVRVPAGDNLWIHRAIYLARPGEVLVVDTGGGHDWGYWGDVLNAAAMARGLGGLVIDGGVRDSNALAASTFPVFSRGLCLRGTHKGLDVPPFVGRVLAIGEAVVAPGDLIVGDRDGVVCIPVARVDACLEAGVRRERDESEKIAQLSAGARSIDIYGFGEGRWEINTP